MHCYLIRCFLFNLAAQSGLVAVEGIKATASIAEGALYTKQMMDNHTNPPQIMIDKILQSVGLIVGRKGHANNPYDVAEFLFQPPFPISVMSAQ